ncbi:hypothetical protein D8674_024526 [Pyrus ussuriensis x Pyrus communis]|uniref:RNase H type-1 domain-containing protein n=1 Tax=Pyrus ussuriensis x Pyrus communis TaxID=2448454 RepID=A0A5N5HGP5_9ROSA|nr:hypothetical protein D8674_024526 [Pyrus ussuriensis x Pyrus communis]
MKCNFDEAWDEQREVGVGVVLRNDAGQFVAAMVRRVEGISSPLQAELEAAHDGVLLAREIGAVEVEFEGDATMVLSVINMLANDHILSRAYNY